jgi:hypothetical protein
MSKKKKGWIVKQWSQQICVENKTLSNTITTKIGCKLKCFGSLISCTRLSSLVTNQVISHERWNNGIQNISMVICNTDIPVTVNQFIVATSTLTWIIGSVSSFYVVNPPSRQSWSVPQALKYGIIWKIYMVHMHVLLECWYI